MKATLFRTGKTTHLHFNNETTDAMSFKEVKVLLQSEHILVRRAGMEDRKTHKVTVHPDRSSSHIGFGIAKVRDFEDYLGHYDVYRQDEDTFILTKINDNSNA